MKKVIVITGASSGMGKEAAKLLINQGHSVYALARRMEEMQDLQQLGGHPMQLDITHEDNVRQVVETIVQREGKIDVLI